MNELIVDCASATEQIIPATIVPGLDDIRPRPLDSVGALATLLAVTGTLTVQDAANAVHLTPDDLEHEALAWGAAAETTP